MTLTIAPAPVRRSFTVKAPPERAFSMFTDGMEKWTPENHTLLKTPRAALVIQPRTGGRWYERGEDGSECDWGHVIVWEPPHRIVLAWQIDATWQFDPALVTEVEARFAAEGKGTRIDFEHRNLERFGANADEIRAALDAPDGWGTLDVYARLLDEEA